MGKFISFRVLKTAFLVTLSFNIMSNSYAGSARTNITTTLEKKPNIIWLITEDNSKHYLKLYDESGAKMPTIEKLAKNGLIFDNAFSNSPVCSTARSTLATGLYGSRLGTMNHRSYKKVSMPEGLNPLGSTSWGETFESDDPTVGSPRTGSFGNLRSSSLEDSNVDLSEELVGLIIAQRNFQASAKTIETSDTVTQTIIQL